MTRAIVYLFIASRLVFVIFSLLAFKFLVLREGYLGSQFDSRLPDFVSIWANFDGRHFLSIATEGYQKTNFAYFPLYPLLISLVGYILPISHVLLGIFISGLAYFLAMIVIFKIIRLDYGLNVVYLSLGLLSFFPLSFFYHSVYTDSLFLLFTVTSFYLARQKNWWLAGLFAGFSTATRFSGIAILPALLVEWYFQNRNLDYSNLKQKFLRTGLLMVVLGSLGLAFYLIYLQILFGDFLLFQKSMIAWGQNGVVFPLQVVWRYIKIFFSVNASEFVFWVAALEFISLILYLVVSLYVFLRVRKSYGIFMFILLSLVSFTGTFAGTPRFALHLFPFFLGLAIMLSKKRIICYFVYFLFLILGVVFTALFTRGYFVA